MQTKFITCPRCDGRGELLRSMARLPMGERCNVCDGSGSLQIVPPPAPEPRPVLKPDEAYRAIMTLPEVEERPVMLAYKPEVEGAALSWNGFNVWGDRKSIEHVRSLINDAHYKGYMQGLLVEARAELAKVRKLLHPGLPG